MLLVSLFLLCLVTPSLGVRFIVGNVQIRLVGGSSSSEGRVEVRRFNNETWGTVCGNHWDAKDAAVVCRQFNSQYTWGQQYVHAGKFGAGTGPIYLSNTNCHGSESNLGQCESNAWGNTDRSCAHYRDVGVSCFRHKVRFRPQRDYVGASYGAVEVLMEPDYEWASVCDSNWDDNDARVVCKSAGFVDGKAQCCGKLTRTYPYYGLRGSVRNISCTGSESSFGSCNKSYSSSSCPSNPGLASAICYSQSAGSIDNRFQIRLTNGSSDWGRVEVKHMGVWGSICAGSSWNDSAASVSCKQFTGRGGGVSMGMSRTDGFQGSRWISQLNCSGSEQSLEQCVVPPWGAGTRYCRPQYALCYVNSAPVVNLVGGDSSSYGRVEITLDGATYTVCDDNWSPYDAKVVCRSLGYAGGQALKGSYYGQGTGHVALNGLLCRGNEDNLIQCPSYGWRQSTTQCNGHTKDASVYCHGQVRLLLGDHSNGILQVSIGGYFRTVCGTGFDDVDAAIACNDLGFEHGRKLPEGSYGLFGSGSYTLRNITCQGSESTIYNCTRTTGFCNTNRNTNYAAVHCYNGSQDTSSTLSLFGGIGQFANSSGHIKLRHHGVNGRICPYFWDDRDAKVACKQLGFTNGVAYGLSSTTVGPFIYSEVNCVGTESSIDNCPMGNSSCTSSTFFYSVPPDAGVFCYSDNGPEIRLVGGTSPKQGRVEIMYRGNLGTVCTGSRYQRDRAARVVCKSLGYTTGYSSSVPHGSGQVALSSLYCSGAESSLLRCRNSGLFAPPSSRCGDHSNDLGVTCQDEVELFQVSQQTSTSIAGVVHLFKGDQWNYVCGTFFDDLDAGVVCRQLGYPYHRALPRGAFGSQYFSNNVVGGVNCTGTESSLGSCPLRVGACNRNSYNYASVICSKVTIPQGVQAVQPTSQPGDVILKVDGLNSAVCGQYWDDKDASVYCRDLGYNFGKAFGSPILHNTNLPYLESVVNCTGTEASINDCTFTSLTHCSRYSAARVFCYNNEQDFQVRLVGGSGVQYKGNVEVGLNGQWGSVCDHNFGWTANDANVVCRSLGYAGGQRNNPGTYGNTARPTFIVSPSCQGSENSITSCRQFAFNNSYYEGYFACSSRPASVRCTSDVKLTPNDTYGAVQMLINPNISSYGLVCSDHFGPEEATVACRNLGFSYGLQMCCSAFGSLSPSHIQRTNLQCTGQELRLQDCPYSDSMAYCPSHQYASVICSQISPSTGYAVSIEKPYNHPYGRPKVKHMGYWGYICTNGFDDNDASVICREAGYAGGVSFRNSLHSSNSFGLHWLSNLKCAGSESYLTRCQNVVWGNLTECSPHGDAGVFCYENSAPQFHLVNGTSSMGRLELWADDMKGSVCHRFFDDREAKVACRGLGFNGGRMLHAGSFGQDTADVIVEYTFCNGKESSLFNCTMLLKGLRSYSWCNAHEHSPAVQCFNTTAITRSRLATYGQVDVFNGQTWVAVCDHGFDMNAAKVACRAAGYTEARPQCCSASGPLRSRLSTFAASTIGAVINHCDGTEASLMDCNISLTTTCPSGMYASVLCSNDAIQEQRLQTRLRETVYGLSRTYLGGVQVNRYGFWGPVCNSSWDDRDANATCHGLGYSYGISYYGRDTTGQPMVIGNFQCTGLESDLANCSFGDIDDDINCSLPLYNYYRRDAGALCFNTPGIGIRLVDGGSRYGRVEVQFQGVWGRVADHWWSTTDATIACNQLGFQRGAPTPYRMRVDHPDRRSKIWLNYVSCAGTERTLFECYNYFDFQSYYGRDANVICYNNVRLSRGNLISAGVVEVNINNKWGSVCDNQWNERNTQLTCQNLGYDNGIHLFCGAFGRTLLPIMESVSCSNSDTDLTKCNHQVPSNFYCDQSSVSVACYNGSRPTAYSYRLESGSADNNTGEVLIEYMNITGRVCSDGWDDNAAKVYCSELGFQFGKAYEHFSYNSRFYFANNGPYWTTNVRCDGTETRLRDCQLSVGDVSQCNSNRGAGVLCTSTEGIYYDLRGSDSGYKGRVEVAVDGVWGSVCRSQFGYRDANVFCRSRGFNGGRVDYSSNSYANPPNKIYQTNLQCRGDEASLNDCPQTAWKTATSSYCTHSRDLNVICYDDVRIGGAYNPSVRQGPVQFYQNNTWYNLCDSGFDDVTAKRVCQDLEFADGKAVCCSAYGSTSYYVRGYQTHLNYTMKCQGNEQTAIECIHPVSTCETGDYASVVCFTSDEYVDESTYSYDFVDSSKRHGVIAVTHMNVTGRVCNTGWSDTDARVLCKSKGHLDGISYRSTQYYYSSFSSRGPFWVSNITCTGNETRLRECQFADRLHLNNCSHADLAAAICFNDSGIQYRISSDVPKPNEGRVEISVDGVWGTVCRYYWDDRDAKVFCRNQGYADGYSISNSFGTTGSGPMWLSSLRCKGTESTLHQCPHAGFKDEPIEDGRSTYGCGSHINDAYVSCVDKLKLNLGYQSSMGAVMVYHQNKWNLICDTGFDVTDAIVVCRQLGYQHGVSLSNSVFGRVDEANITITNVRCRGTETDVTTCAYDVSSACRSQTYASVLCSQDPIQEEAQNVRIIHDDPNEPRHGYLEYQVDGVWGAMCANTIDTKTISVACKQLGFTGGQLYRPRFSNYQQPILTSNLKCKGTESRLDNCPHTSVPASAWCDFYAPRAGALCYNDTDGISYQLTGDSVSSRGRFEMKYMGQFGSSCSFPSRHMTAKVACKSVGYKDGLAIMGDRYSVGNSEPVWFMGLSCQGNESSITECSSYGFNSVPGYFSYEYYCRLKPLSVQCYQNELVVTDVRLVNGDTNSSGRVEVFLQGPKAWGTVCDDLWDDVDATVVCNQLGYATGKAVLRAGFGQGSGGIYMDNVGCKGTEVQLQDCGFSGYFVHNCRHSEDAGVRCFGTYVSPTTSTPKNTKPGQKENALIMGNTDKPGTSKHTGDESNNTAAIVAPIVVILVIGIAAGAGFMLYRQRRSNTNLQLLVDSGASQLDDSGASQSGSLSFSRGVVKFVNRVLGHENQHDESSAMGNISNPSHADQGIVNPNYNNAAGILPEHHADWNSEA